MGETAAKQWRALWSAVADYTIGTAIVVGYRLARDARHRVVRRTGLRARQ